MKHHATMLAIRLTMMYLWILNKFSMILTCQLSGRALELPRTDGSNHWRKSEWRLRWQSQSQFAPSLRLPSSLLL